MEELVQILSEHKGTGTLWGISYWTNTCGYKAKLDKEAKVAREVAKIAGIEVEDKYQARVGTCFHKTEELYLKGTLPNVAWPVNDKYDRDDPIQEALRVFAVYKRVFPTDEFTLVEGEELWPKTTEQAKALAATIGLDPYTFQPDQVVHFNEEQCEKARQTRFVDLFPGYYLRDTKTHGKKDSSAAFQYSIRIQFQVYLRAYNSLFPDRPLNGLLVNDIICHADLTKKSSSTGQWESFKSYVIPPDSDLRWESLRRFLVDHGEYVKSGKKNLLACGDWGGCIYAKNGACDRLY